MTPTSVDGATPIPSAARTRGREIILWSALTVALSASWADLAGHWLAEPWARPAALFVPLFVAVAAREPVRRGSRGVGAALVAAGLGLSLVAAGGGLTRMGRLGIPLGTIGMARALGRPSLATSLLALWIVPPPFALARLLSPGLEHGIASLAVRAAEARGLPAALGLGSLDLGGAALALAPTDGGLPLAFYLAGVGWWGAVRVGGGPSAAAAAALRFAPFGFLAQAIGLALACALLATGAAGAARALLDAWAWPVLGLAVAWVVWRRPRFAQARS
jgi:hypothetical protein